MTLVRRNASAFSRRVLAGAVVLAQMAPGAIAAVRTGDGRAILAKRADKPGPWAEQENDPK